MKMRNADGTYHFSDLKKLALSPAHYRHSCLSIFETTRPMRVGSCVHQRVLGPQRGKEVIVYEGERKSNAWKDFAAASKLEHPDAELVTSAEWDDSHDVAAAVLADPIALELLAGTRREQPITWEHDGFTCSTRGIDFVGNGYCGELKTTRSAEPEHFKRQGASLLYHAQASFYADGAQANGIDMSKGFFVIAVETSEPHPVTVLRFTPAALDLGRKTVALWFEKLRACEESDFWPAYSQSIVDFDLPSWMSPEEDGDGDEAAA
jgi:hypothetical protein